MRKFLQMLFTGSFFSFTSYFETKKNDLQIGDDSQKGPPGKKDVNLAYFIAAEKTNSYVGINDYI